jgi:hypothetical protein
MNSGPAAAGLAWPAQVDDRHPGSPVIVQAGQLRVHVQRSGRRRAKRSSSGAGKGAGNGDSIFWT